MNETGGGSGPQIKSKEWTVVKTSKDISACALFKPGLYFLPGSDHLLYRGYINNT